MFGEGNLRERRGVMPGRVVSAQFLGGMDVLVQDDGVLWSGRRLENEAVVRTVKQGGGTAKIAIEPWPGRRVELQAAEHGETYLLRPEGAGVRVERK